MLRHRVPSMPRTLTLTAIATLLAALVLAAVPDGAAAAKKKLRKVAVQSDAAVDAVAYGRRDDVMQFGADIAARHGLALARDAMRVAINDEFGDWQHSLQSGDRLVFIPPVAGG